MTGVIHVDGNRCNESRCQFSDVRSILCLSQCHQAFEIGDLQSSSVNLGESPDNEVFQIHVVLDCLHVYWKLG